MIENKLYVLAAMLMLSSGSYAIENNRLQVHTQAELDAALTSNPVVFLLVSAKWCPHCRALKPVVEQLRQELKNVLFVHIDADDKTLADKYAPHVYPTMQIYKDGALVETVEGTRSKEQLKNLVK